MATNFTTRLFAGLSVLLSTAFTARAQNNACGITAPLLTVNGSCSTTAYTITSGFTADTPTGTSCVAGGDNREDGWFRFVATGTTTYITATGNRNVCLAVYDGPCPSTSTEIGCVNSGGCGVTETLVVTTTIGATYYIRVIRFDTNCGGSTLSGDICVFTPAPPANDNCVTATALTVGATCSATSSTNLGATATGGVAAPSCSTYGNNDVWFSFTAPSANLEITTTAGGMTDAAMSLYSGTCGSLTELDCDNDAGSGTMPYITRCDFVSGTTYYIRVWGDGGDLGTFDICVNNTGGASSGTTANCAGGSTVCNDASFSGNSSGAGDAELTTATDGCLSGEHQSSWYFFQTLTAGTVQLNITPANGTDDYDFAVWGPFTSGVACPPCTAPLRCSYAAGGGTTGLSTGAADVSEGSTGNRFVSAINASAGDQYVLLVDNYSSSSSPFTLDWTLTGGATLGCLVLPVELVEFTGVSQGHRNKLTWKTASETDNDYFTVEKSTDGFNYTVLTTVPGAGNSSSVRTYHAFDENPSAICYYRLKQTDFDGHSVYSNVVVIKTAEWVNTLPLEVFPVPATGTINVLFSGSPTGNTDILITDLTGRLLYTQTVNSNNGSLHTIDVSQLGKGIYMLVAENKDLNKRSTIRKIVVE